MRIPILLLTTFLYQLQCSAQTATVTNAAGLTVVQVVTTDPIAHSPITTTILTLSASTAATPIPDDPGVQQGPVGQPAPTVGTPGGPTPYTYITVINGVTTRVADVFTPTNPATNPPNVPAIGTIMDYSSWLAAYGPPPSAGAAHLSPPFPAAWIGVFLTSLVAVTAGYWVLL